MMKKRFVIGSLLVASFLYAQATPQVEITQEDIKIQNEMSDASSKDITPKSLDDFLKNLQIILV